MGTSTEAVKPKRGGRRPGAGRPSNDKRELMGLVTGLSDLAFRKRLRRLYEEDITQVNTQTWRFLAQYWLGKIPDPDKQKPPRKKSRGMAIILLKGLPGQYDPLADRMPKALPAQTVIDTEPELPPDPNMPALVDIPESG